MNKEILLVVDAVSREKGVEKEVIFEALEEALAVATKKQYSGNPLIQVKIDRKTGGYESYRCWNVISEEEDSVASLEFPEQVVVLSEAQKKNPSLQVGDVYKEFIPSVRFGRIGAQIAKQVIVQKVREAERAQVASEYIGKVGQLISGIARQTGREGVTIDVGNGVEAFLRRDEMIPRESLRPGDRIRSLLLAVRTESRGALLLTTRTRPEVLIELFKLEVPEIDEGLVEIIGAARDPGIRAKIAVKSAEPRIDPVGACVGMRGARVQAISNELAGERVDIVLWDENPAQFVINALAPAEISSIVVDEEKHSMDVAVSDEQLPQAVGRNGQNVRLASEVTGWELNVISLTQATLKSEAETKDLRALFVMHLGVDEEIADILIREGFASVEEVAYVPIQELLDIKELTEAVVNEIRARAKDYLLTKALTEEQPVVVKPTDDLLAVEGMDEKLARALAERGIVSREDLAEQAVDDLLEIEEITRERAAALIMSARAIWFTQ